MAGDFSPTARRLGIASAVAVVVLLLAYALTLTVGLLSLASPQQPIGDPMFSILEILILLTMPAMVALMVAVHAWAPARAKSLSLTAVVFMGLLATVTCSLHFVILTLSHKPEFADQAWLPLVLSFQWPSVAYAVDILAWDIFFPLSMLFAAPVFGGSRLAGAIRALMIVSGVLAFAGLSGVVTGDMQLRNIGIVGYVGVFVVVAGLLGVLFYQAESTAAWPNRDPISDTGQDRETAMSNTESKLFIGTLVVVLALTMLAVELLFHSKPAPEGVATSTDGPTPTRIITWLNVPTDAVAFATYEPGKGPNVLYSHEAALAFAVARLQIATPVASVVRRTTEAQMDHLMQHWAEGQFPSAFSQTTPASTVIPIHLDNSPVVWFVALESPTAIAREQLLRANGMAELVSMNLPDPASGGAAPTPVAAASEAGAFKVYLVFDELGNPFRVGEIEGKLTMASNAMAMPMGPSFQQVASLPEVPSSITPEP